MEWMKTWGAAPQTKNVSVEDLREDLDTPAVVAPAKVIDKQRKEIDGEKKVTASAEDVGLDLMAPTAEGETLSPMAAQLPTMEELAAKFRGEKPAEVPKSAMEELGEKFKAEAKPDIHDRLRRLHERRTGEVVSTESFLGFGKPKEEPKPKESYTKLVIDKNNPPTISASWHRAMSTLKHLDEATYNALMSKLVKASDEDFQAFTEATNVHLPADVRSFLSLCNGDIRDFNLRYRKRLPMALFEYGEIFSLKGIANEINYWKQVDEKAKATPDSSHVGFIPVARNDSLVWAIAPYEGKHKGCIVKTAHFDDDFPRNYQTIHYPSFRAFIAFALEGLVEELYRYQ